MLKQQRPATLEAFLELVNQTIFEVQELRMSLEYDSEDMQEAPAFVNQLEQQLASVRKQIGQGDYPFADEDLPFMAIVEHQSDYLLPFKGLLRQVNNTHRLGLESQGLDFSRFCTA